MNISVFGTNGLLSDAIGLYCEKQKININSYGLNKPISHNYARFQSLNLLKDPINYKQICQSDVIIYSAGAGIQSNLNESSNLIYSLNVEIPIRICNQLKMENFKGSFISFGSYFEIGVNNDSHYFDENELLQSQRKVINDYSISKRMFSRFISSIEMPFKTWHFILPTIYGEKEASHRLIPYTIKALKNNENLEFTSGEQIRQYIYIEEVVEIIFKAYSLNIQSGLYNIQGVETISVRELVTELFSLFGKQLPTNVFGKAERGDSGMKKLMLNGDKLQQAINYKPKLKISDVYDRY